MVSGVCWVAWMSWTGGWVKAMRTDYLKEGPTAPLLTCAGIMALTSALSAWAIWGLT